MKATGVVRRIDDLGRIVIPKEIRRNLRIRDGESLEIFVDSNSIILKKFSIMRNIDDYAKNLVDALYSFIKKSIIITDNDSIIACSSNIKDKLINKSICENLSVCIKRRESLLEKYDKVLNITDDFSICSKYVINSIVANGDCVGLVIIYDDNIDDDDMKLSLIASKILSKSIEE